MNATPRTMANPITTGCPVFTECTSVSLDERSGAYGPRALVSRGGDRGSRFRRPGRGRDRTLESESGIEHHPVTSSDSGDRRLPRRAAGENRFVDTQQHQQADALRAAVDARRRLGVRWPVVALVAGVLGVLLGLLLGWL